MEEVRLTHTSIQIYQVTYFLLLEYIWEEILGPHVIAFLAQYYFNLANLVDWTNTFILEHKINIES